MSIDAIFGVVGVRIMHQIFKTLIVNANDVKSDSELLGIDFFQSVYEWPDNIFAARASGIDEAQGFSIVFIIGMPAFGNDVMKDRREREYIAPFQNVVIRQIGTDGNNIAYFPVNESNALVSEIRDDIICEILLDSTFFIPFGYVSNEFDIVLFAISGKSEREEE